MHRSRLLVSLTVTAGVLAGCQAPRWDPATAPPLTGPSGLAEIRLLAKGIE